MKNTLYAYAVYAEHEKGRQAVIETIAIVLLVLSNLIAWLTTIVVLLWARNIKRKSDAIVEQSNAFVAEARTWVVS